MNRESAERYFLELERQEREWGNRKNATTEPYQVPVESIISDVAQETLLNFRGVNVTDSELPKDANVSIKEEPKTDLSGIIQEFRKWERDNIKEDMWNKCKQVNPRLINDYGALVNVGDNSKTSGDMSYCYRKAKILYGVIEEKMT